MANVGDKVSVGSKAPTPGQYKHTVCSNTIILNQGNIIPPYFIIRIAKQFSDKSATYQY